MLETLASKLARLPAVDRLLKLPAAQPLVNLHGRTALTAAIRATLSDTRDRIREGAEPPDDPAILLADAAARLEADDEPQLRPVFNFTGTILHTNLGRAPLPPEAIAAVATVAGSASNLEYDLDTGRRGDRDSHLEAEICRTTRAEAATVVNNNAAAVMLVLNTLALGKAVPVSRGELVEIGGSFRIPDIMTRSGCRLVEVGTTNRTHLKDFASAMDSDTAMVMKVHTSNYVIEGFTAAVPERELAALCREHGVPFVNDLGSGTLANLEDFGLPHEPTPMDALQAGADVVTFSGDKLLGGPQAGLIVGRKDLLARIKSNPMKRALRCDKMTIAALSAVLRLYANPDALARRLPALAAMTRDPSDIRNQCERLRPHVEAALAASAEVAVVACESEIGSGALPTRTVPSSGLAISPRPDGRGTGTELQRLATAFRQLARPVIGRINDGRLVFDLRCLSSADEAAFLAQLQALEFTQ